MKTLIILHGWQSSEERWQKVKENIESDEIEVIVPDIPGFKPGTELEKPWNLDDYVEWLKDFSQDREKFFLLGHSFGGRIAIKFAIKYPQKLFGLILVSAGGVESKRALKKLTIQFLTPRLKKFSFLPRYNFFRKLFYKFVVKKTDYLEVKGYLKDTFKKVIEEDLIPLLKEIKVPVLILWGEKDKTLPLRDAYLIKEEIKFSQLEILKNIRHNPHSENPQLLAQKIKEFLK